MTKKYIILLVLIGLITLGFSQNRRPAVDSSLTVDFENYNPPSTLVVDENPLTSAKFPFIDVHSHHFRMATQDLDKLIKEMDELNMGVIVNLSGRGAKELEAMLANVKKYGYEDRIAIFSNVSFNGIDEPGWADNAVKQLEYDVKNGAKGLKIYKSLGLRSADSKGNRIAVDDARIDPVWAKCGELGIPVLIHSADPKQFWQPHDGDNERWLELKLRPGRKRGADNPVPFEQIIEEQHNVVQKASKYNFYQCTFWMVCK